MRTLTLELLESLGRPLTAYELRSGRVYSGQRLERDRRRVRRALLLLASHEPIREVARRMRIGQSSLVALRRRAKLDGRMAWARKVVAERLSVGLERQLDALLDGGGMFDPRRFGADIDQFLKIEESSRAD